MESVRRQWCAQAISSRQAPILSPGLPHFVSCREGADKRIYESLKIAPSWNRGGNTPITGGNNDYRFSGDNELNGEVGLVAAALRELAAQELYMARREYVNAALANNSARARAGTAVVNRRGGEAAAGGVHAPQSARGLRPDGNRMSVSERSQLARQQRQQHLQRQRQLLARVELQKPRGNAPTPYPRARIP